MTPEHANYVIFEFELPLPHFDPNVATYIWVPFDNAMLTDVDPVLEAEQIGHLPLGALAKTHSGLQTLHVLPWASLGLPDLALDFFKTSADRSTDFFLF